MDPERTDWASRRCAAMILELAGGTLHDGLIDVRNGSPHERAPIALRFEQVPRVLGIEIPPDRACAILESIGLEPVGRNEAAATFRAPSWRSDLEREIDLIEEVARVHGYEQIPEDRPVPLASSRLGPRERLERAVREALTGLGFDEAVCYSLVPDEFDRPARPPARRPGDPRPARGLQEEQRPAAEPRAQPPGRPRLQ